MVCALHASHRDGTRCSITSARSNACLRPGRPCLTVRLRESEQAAQFFDPIIGAREMLRAAVVCNKCMRYICSTRGGQGLER